ncbi:hypothetical protein SAMN06298212_10955 [Ruaniaceae bacterium KH17]|nr:hypothetical protein SAMN06298212_10955 [Ruaniaceae bacterium KH17]
MSCGIPGPSPSVRSVSRTAVGLIRLFSGVGILAVLGYTYALGIVAGRTSLLNFFGFFTNSSSLLAALVLITAGTHLAIGSEAPSWLATARAAIGTALLVVGVGYNASGLVGTAPAWVSLLLHTIVPIAMLLDWALIGDRGPLAWRHLWRVLVYPAAWLMMIRWRWNAHEWVPYEFLRPTHGPLALMLALAVLLAGMLLAAGLFWALSRYRGLALSPATISSASSPTPSGSVVDVSLAALGSSSPSAVGSPRSSMPAF